MLEGDIPSLKRRVCCLFMWTFLIRFLWCLNHKVMENKTYNTSTAIVTNLGKHEECSSVSNENDKIKNHVTGDRTRKRRALTSDERNCYTKGAKNSYCPCSNVDQQKKDRNLVKRFEKTSGFCFKDVEVSLRRQRQDFLAVSDLGDSSACEAEKELKPVKHRKGSKSKAEDAVKSNTDRKDDNLSKKQSHSEEDSKELFRNIYHRPKYPYIFPYPKEEVWKRCQEQIEDFSKQFDFAVSPATLASVHVLRRVQLGIQNNLSCLHGWLGEMPEKLKTPRKGRCRYYEPFKLEPLKIVQDLDLKLPKNDSWMETQAQIIVWFLTTWKFVNEQVMVKVIEIGEETIKTINQYIKLFEGKASFSDVERPWEYLISKLYEIHVWKNKKNLTDKCIDQVTLPCTKTPNLVPNDENLNCKFHIKTAAYEKVKPVSLDNTCSDFLHSVNADNQTLSGGWKKLKPFKLVDTSSGLLDSINVSKYKPTALLYDSNSKDKVVYGSCKEIDREILKECYTSVHQVFREVDFRISSVNAQHKDAMRKAEFKMKSCVTRLQTLLETFIFAPEKYKPTKCNFLEEIKWEVLGMLRDESTDDDWMKTQERILECLLTTMTVVSETVLVKIFNIGLESIKNLNLYINVWNNPALLLDIDHPWEFMIKKLHEIKQWKRNRRINTSVNTVHLLDAKVCQITGGSDEKLKCVSKKESGFCPEENTGFRKTQVYCYEDSSADLLNAVVPESALKNYIDKLDGFYHSNLSENTINECKMCIQQIINDLDFSVHSQKSLHIKTMKRVESSVKKTLNFLKNRLGKKRYGQMLDVQCKTLEVLKTKVLTVLKDEDTHTPNSDDWMETQERILECLLTAMTFVHDLVLVKVCNVDKETEKTLHLYTDVWDRTTSFSDIERPWEYLISKLHEIHLWKLEREKSEIIKVKLQNNLGTQIHQGTTNTDKESDSVSKNRDSADASSKRETAKLNEKSSSFNFNTSDALLNKKINSSEDADAGEKVNNFLVIVKNTNLGVRQYKDSTNSGQNWAFDKDVARASIQIEAEKKHCKGQDSNESPNTRIEGFKSGKLHETHILRKERGNNSKIMKMKLKKQSNANTNQITTLTDKGSYFDSENEVVSCLEKNAGFQQNRTVKRLKTSTWNDPTSREKIAKLDDSTSSGYLDGADASPKKVTSNADDNALITYVERIVASSNKETDKTNENSSSCLKRKHENNDNRIENTSIIESVKNTQYMSHQLRRSKGSENSSNERTSGMDLAVISVQTDLVSEDGRVCTAVNSIAKNCDSGIVKQIDELRPVTRVKDKADSEFGKVHRKDAYTSEKRCATKRILSDREKLSRAMKGLPFYSDVDCFVKDPVSQGVVFSCLSYIEHIKVKCETDLISDQSLYSGECKRVYSVLNSHLSALSYFLKHQVETVKEYNFLTLLKLGVMTVLNDADKRIRNNNLWIDTQKHILDCLFCTLKDVYEHVLIKIFYVKEVTQKMINFYFCVCKGIITLLGGGISSDFLLAKYHRIQLWQAGRKLTETNTPECPGLAGPLYCTRACQQPVTTRGLNVVKHSTDNTQPLCTDTHVVVRTFFPRYSDIRRRFEQPPIVNTCTTRETVGFNTHPNCTKSLTTTTVVQKQREAVPFHAYDINMVLKKSEASLGTTTGEATDFTKKTLPSESRNQDNKQESKETMPVNSSYALNGMSTVLQDIKKEHELADEPVTVKEEPVEDEIAVVQNSNLVVKPSEQMVDVKKETEDVDFVKDIKQEPLGDVKQSRYVDVMYEDSTDKEPFFVTLNDDWVNSMKSPVKTENIY